MSVINQMLKELDQRNNATVSSGGNIHPGYVTPEEKNYSKIIALIAVVVTLIIAAILYWQFTASVERSHSDLGKVEITEKPINSTANDNNIEEHTLVAEKLPVEIEETLQGENFGDQLIQQANINQDVVLETVTKNTLVEKSLSEKAVKKISIEQKTNNLTEEEVATGLDRIVKSHRQPDTKTQADRLYRSAREKLALNQLSDARTLLNQAIKRYPEHHKARVLWFSLLLKQQQLDVLQAQLEQSQQQWPEVHQYRQMKARLLLQQGLKAEALVELEKVVPQVTEAPEYHALLAYVAQQLGSDQLARKHYQLLLQQHPQRADWWLGLGVSEERLGNKSPALQAYQHATARPGLSLSVQQYAKKRIRILQGF